jgi:hypothetical protein
MHPLGHVVSVWRDFGGQDDFVVVVTRIDVTVTMSSTIEDTIGPSDIVTHNTTSWYIHTSYKKMKERGCCRTHFKLVLRQISDFGTFVLEKSTLLIPT